MKNNKKGISAIVATVLIILITVAAVTIIWAAIIPMISNELGGATECFDASAALSVVSDYSCWNDTVGCSGGVATECVDDTTPTEGECTAQSYDTACAWDGSACSGGIATECVDDTSPTEGECTAQSYDTDCAWSTSSVDIQVARTTGDFTLLGVDISGIYLGSSDVVKITEDHVKGLPDANGATVYTIGLGTGDGEFNLEGIDSASVAARVEAGQTEKLCDGSAVTVIREC